MSNDCLEAVLDELNAVNIKPRVEFGGKHIKVMWPAGGREWSQIVSKTPSDIWSLVNERAQTRRYLREAGLLAAEEITVMELPRLTLRAGAPVVSSLDVARHFDKLHRDILRSIDRAVEETGMEFGLRNFAQSSYLNEQNKEIRCFDLTRDGFSFLVMGFTGAAAAKWKVAYINAFNAMEAEIKRAEVPYDPALPVKLAQVEADLNALIDLSLDARPQRAIRRGLFMRPSIRRRLLRMGVAA